MQIYDKASIGRMAAEFGYIRDTFEKVVRLGEILKYFNEQDYLKEHLLLKGGTAINLTIFNLPRLSVDIDLDYMPNDTRDDMLASRDRITRLIKDYMAAEGYYLSPASRFSHSLDAFYYQYQNTGGNRDMIKIELNYSLRAHILEPEYRKILPAVFGISYSVRTVAPMEIFAAKGNALISRAAARDLYDWGNMILENLFKEDRDLFRKCFVFYYTISAEKVDRSFDTKAIDSLDFGKIKRDLFPVLSKKDNFHLEDRKREAKEYMENLIKLSENEIEYIDRFAFGEYRPELLFENEGIAMRIKEHPMALWKCKR